MPPERVHLHMWMPTKNGQPERQSWASERVGRASKMAVTPVPAPAPDRTRHAPQEMSAPVPEQAPNPPRELRSHEPPPRKPRAYERLRHPPREDRAVMQCPRVALANVLAQAPERAVDRMDQMEQTRFVSHSTWHQAAEASKIESVQSAD